MGYKLREGTYETDPGGMPKMTSGLEELLQNAWLRLTIPKGSFPYGREYGSRLSGLDAGEEHAVERALALANEALFGLPGVRAKHAALQGDGEIAFTLETPLGEGEVIYGKL